MRQHFRGLFAATLADIFIVVANMFFIPLGILFDADVSPDLLELLSQILRSPCRSPSLNIFASTFSSFPPSLPDSEFLPRSLIATFLGNIIGALFVALPAVYIYLGDYHYSDSEASELESGDAAQEVIYVQDKGSK